MRSISLWGILNSAQSTSDTSINHAIDPVTTSTSSLGHDGKILLAQQQAAAETKVPIHAIQETSEVISSTPLTEDRPAESTSSTSQIVPESNSGQVEEFSFLNTTEKTAESIAEAPERIGYLKEVCGLDFGWGPAAMAEWLLEHIHVVGGFTWVTSSILVAALIRMFLFVGLARSSDMGARLKAAKPMLEPVQAKMREAASTKDRKKQLEARAELAAIRREYEISYTPLFLPVMVQIPAGIAGYRLLSNMAQIPVPALTTEQFLWMHNLTTGDPYFIFPLLNAVFVHFTIVVCVVQPALVPYFQLTVLCL